MIETMANLVWQAMALLSAMALLLGAVLCALHVGVPRGGMSFVARRVLQALGSGLRKAGYRCEHLAYRQF